MRTIIKTILLAGVILLACNGLWGCNGEKVPMLRDIQGPAIVDEYSYAEYSISLVNATGATLLWMCEPEDAGWFDAPASPKTGFTASEVMSDTPAKITVLISSDQFLPVLKSKNITIRDVTKFSVGEIEGLDTIEENSSGTYSITATGDTGITYQWATIPVGFGLFDAPQQAVTQFSAPEVDEDASIQLQVEINSDNYSPVLRSTAVTIMNMEQYGWAHTWGGDGWDTGYGVAVDNEGNIYLTGEFESTVDFDPDAGIDEHTSNGHGDIFLSKFDSNGNYQWVRTWGGYKLDEGLEVAVDGSGNVYVTGYFYHTVDFDPGSGVDEHKSEGDSDIFLSKFDSNGNFQWARTWGEYRLDEGWGVTVDGSGNIYVTGSFEGTVDFDPGYGVDGHVSQGYGDIFLSKFDSSGGFQWARTWGEWLWDKGWGVAVDGSGNVYVTGYFSDIVDFDPGGGIDEHTSNGYTDIFLSKFDSSGGFQWARTWGGVFWDESWGVAVDGSGNIYVTRYFQGTVDFDPSDGIDEHASNGYREVFLSKFDSSGGFHWARTWGGDSWDYGNGVTVDGSGNIYVTGRFEGSVDFDPGGGINEHTSNGYGDISLSKFDSNGIFLWVRTWGGGSYDYSYGVAVDESGNAYVTGRFAGAVDFDPGPGVDEHTSNGAYGAFLSKFPPDGD